MRFANRVQKVQSSAIRDLLRHGTDPNVISFAGGSHNMTATADIAIPAGSVVTVVAVAGTNLVVAPTPVATSEGARSDA